MKYRKPGKKSLKIIIILIFLLSVSLIAVYFKNKQKIVNQIDKNNIFISYTTSGNELIVKTFNVISNESFEKKIILEDEMDDSSKWTSVGVDYAVQFNPVTKDIFILTEGTGSHLDDSGQCLNADKTCYDRIYKTNLKSDEINKMYEGGISNFLLDTKNNQIIINDYNPVILKAIDIDTGKINYSKEYNGTMLSIDKNNFLYLSSQDDTKLNLKKINLKDGSLVKEYNEILGLKYFSGYPDVSPDGRYLIDTVFYTIKDTVWNYYIYDLKQEKLFYSSKESLSGKWSGDGKKILVSNKDFSFFDLETKKISRIESSMSNIYILDISPNFKYAINEDNDEIALHHLDDDTTLSLFKIDWMGDLKGISWY